jgi:hypothetical protein
MQMGPGDQPGFNRSTSIADNPARRARFRGRNPGRWPAARLGWEPFREPGPRLDS